MATAKKNLGKMPCPGCGDPTAVFQAKTGTLSYKCQHADCESSGYAAKHTGAAKKWLSQLPAQPIEQPPKATPPKAEKVPPAVPSKAGFSMSNL